MILNNNLKEIFRLAFQTSPQEAEYYALKILVSLPKEFRILGQQGRNEYELNEPDQIQVNFEREELENMISKLRFSSR